MTFLPGPELESNWYCVEAEARREHAVAAPLREFPEVKAFCPRIQFREASLAGIQSVPTEALFPGYRFVRFRLAVSHRVVRFAQGVRGIVVRGDEYTCISAATIEELGRKRDRKEIKEVDALAVPPDHGGNVFSPNLLTLLVKLLPSRERVKILLDFLGQQRDVEPWAHSVLSRFAAPLNPVS